MMMSHLIRQWKQASIALLAAALFLPATALAQQITGAGSTFVNPIMSHWTADFHKLHPNVEVNYQSVGSGAGIQQLKSKLVDFGASDVALNDEQLKSMPMPIVQIPESAGPVCITYNLEGLSKPLQLSGDALAGIYLGKITKWSDQAITKTNAGVKLPDDDIVVVHRSDGSGTTGIFTTYLSAISSEWKSKVGSNTSVSWPVGLGGKGSEGVTGVVKQTPGAIGYVELSYAEENHLPVALMGNQAGKFVAPSADSASAAIAAFRSELAKDVRTPIVNPPASAAAAYPITGLTFLLVPKQGADKSKSAATRQFIEYAISTGQNIAAQLHYAPLPPGIISVDKKMLAEIH